MCVQSKLIHVEEVEEEQRDMQKQSQTPKK